MCEANKPLILNANKISFIHVAKGQVFSNLIGQDSITRFGCLRRVHRVSCATLRGNKRTLCQVEVILTVPAICFVLGLRPVVYAATSVERQRSHWSLRLSSIFRVGRTTSVGWYGGTSPNKSFGHERQSASQSLLLRCVILVNQARFTWNHTPRSKCHFSFQWRVRADMAYQSARSRLTHTYSIRGGRSNL